VPPVQYPDGRWYIKMGGSYRRAATFTDPAEMNQWMAGNDADDQLEVMRDVLQTVLPTVTITGWSMKPCLITDTASDLPFVAQVDDRLTVAIGGNGHAAKSADGIGRLAVDLVRNERWTDPELDEAAFAARFGHHVPPARSRHGN